MNCCQGVVEILLQPRFVNSDTQYSWCAEISIGVQQLTPVTPKRRWGGTPTDASAAVVTHRLLSSAMYSNDDNDWPVHSWMLFSVTYAVLLCGDYHLLFPVE